MEKVSLWWEVGGSAMANGNSISAMIGISSPVKMTFFFCSGSGTILHFSHNNFLYLLTLDMAGYSNCGPEDDAVSFV